MGRFFLIIMGLLAVDQINILVEEIFVIDLSKPYFEVTTNVANRSIETRVCVNIGLLKVFCNYMA